MSIEEKKYLFDISKSIEIIEDFMPSDISLSDFKNNQMLQDAVTRRLEIIGEATICLLKLNPEIQISDSRKIKGLRNRIAHEYDMIAVDEIWVIIQRSLPKLKTEVSTLLNEN
jgi:uncharacterized protein with HEPN domain